MDTPEDEAALEFVLMRAQDRASGRELGLAHYLASFPDHVERIAREYLAMEDEAASARAEPDREDTGPRMLGGYRVLEEIGRGGQGVVYLAEDERLGRRVALKVLSGTFGADDALLERFRREASTAARIDHPGICKVYELGEEDGVWFLAMQLVPGVPLSRSIGVGGDDATMVELGAADDEVTVALTRAGGRPISSTVAFFEDAARAVHAAHAAGIVHRDIKPGNIMVTPDGEPVLLDFGLAREDEDELLLTQSGDVFGTPAYMSPEQIRGHRDGIDHRTDVWSLGVALYECLTGRRPFESTTREGLVQAILDVEPTRLRRLEPGAGRDLEVVVATALAKERDRRYETAHELAEDLRRVREHRPIGARPVGLAGRLARWARRNRSLACGILVLLAALAAALIGFVGESRARGRADQERGRADAALDEYERLADAHRLEELLQEAGGDLWPVHPRRIEDYGTWLAEARELEARRSLHARTLEELRRRALPYDDASRRADRRAQIERHQVVRRITMDLADVERGLGELSGRTGARTARRREQLEERKAELVERRAAFEPVLARRLTWKFADARDAWRHARQSEFATRLRRFLGDDQRGETLASVAWRLEMARSLHLPREASGHPTWDAAVRAVAQRHDGLRLVPQVGLIPLGPDPDSGLWEFCDWQTGEVPGRDAAGRLVLSESSAIVFVLLPGGTFLMGAQGSDPQAPNFDPDARRPEGPVHPVTLAPFFMAKHEMSQAQWLRATAQNPSYWREGKSARRGSRITSRHPVEQVTWHEAVEELRRLGLRLPTEAQWEYACRAETTTVYSMGNDEASLRGYANVADAGSQQDYPRGWDFVPGLDDGYSSHAPIGSFRANPWGFHDMHGNVAEWCADVIGAWRYDRFPARTGDGLRDDPRSKVNLVRGGSYSLPGVNLRTGARGSLPPDDREQTLGVRAARPLDPE